MKYFRKNILIAIALGLFLSSTFFVHSAHALDGITIANSVVNSVLGWLFYVVGYIAAATFSLGGYLIEYALELNSKVMDLPVVLVGWKITLNITNLAFVLGIIVIAIGTILRNQTYGMKKLLFNFVVAAVMVNFSLVIVGPILDFSGIVTQFFVQKVSPSASIGGFKGFSDQLVASFNPQAFQNVKALGDSAAQAGSASFEETPISGSPLSFLANLAFIATFTLMGAIVFLGIAVMLLIRFIFIAILLVLAPIVWLGYVFPEFKKYWDEWWGTFLKWVLFAPACTFFLYLATFTALNRGKYLEQVAGNIKYTGVIQADIGNIAEGLVMLGLMLASLMVAEKFGITGAAVARGAAESGGKALIGWSGKAAARYTGGLGAGAARLADRAGGGLGGRFLGGAAARLHSMQTTIASAPGIGKVVVGIGKEARSLRDSVGFGIKSGSGLKLFKDLKSPKEKAEEAEKKKKELDAKIEKIEEQLDKLESEKFALSGELSQLQALPAQTASQAGRVADITVRIFAIDTKRASLQTKLTELKTL